MGVGAYATGERILSVFSFLGQPKAYLFESKDTFCMDFVMMVKEEVDIQLKN